MNCLIKPIVNTSTSNLHNNQDVLAYLCMSSATMQTGFPTPTEPNIGEHILFILTNSLQYICKCAQMQKSTISKKMNLLYTVVDPSLYIHHSTGEAYLAGNYPFPTNLKRNPNSRIARTTTNVPLQKICTQSNSKHTAISSI